MSQFIQSITTWVKRPNFNDFEKDRSAVYLQAIALIIIGVSLVISAIYAFDRVFGYVFLNMVVILVFGLTIILVRVKRLQFASNLFLIASLGLLTFGILSSGSIHATTTVMYPVILIFASLLLKRDNFVLYASLCIASIGFIVFAEHQRLIPPYTPDPPDFPLFITSGLIIGAAAVVIRFITESLQNSLLSTRQAMHEIVAQKIMLDHVGQAVVGCDRDGAIIYWNQAATDLYGWQEKEVLSSKYFDFVPIQMQKETTEEIRQVMWAGNIWSGEMKVRKRDQSWITILGTIAPLKNNQGMASGWISIAADLTERKQAEQVSKRRAEEMSFLYQIGIAVASGKDLYGTLLTLRTEIMRLIEADAFYVAIYDEKTDIVSYPVFLDNEEPLYPVNRHLHEKPGLTGAVIFSNKTLYLPDMMKPDVQEKYHPYDTTLGVPLHTFLGIPFLVNGHVIGMVSIQSRQVDAYNQDQIQLMENIAVQAALAVDKARLLDQLQQELAERKRTEAALSLSEEKFHQAFHTTPVLMSIEDADHRFIDVNRAFIETIGYKREEIIGRHAADLQMWSRPEDMHIVRRQMETHGRLKDLELQYRRRSGETRYMLMSSESFDVGEDTYALTSGLDITERKQAEISLRQREIILDAVAYAAELFLKSPNWTGEINVVLELLGRSINATHAYLFRNDTLANGEITTSMIFEWAAPNFPSDLGNPTYTNTPIEKNDLESWYQAMHKGAIYIGDLKHLPDEDMQYLLERNIKALLELPIFIKGTWWGTIGFDDMSNAREWTNTEMDALKVAASILGGAIQRQQTDAILKDELVQRRQLIEELEKKNAESETLRETTAIVTSTLDAAESVQQILQQLKRVIPYDSASVWLYRGDIAVMVGWHGLPKQSIEPGKYLLGEAEPDYALQAENAPYVLLEDIQKTHPQFRTPTLSYIRAWLAVPLRARGKLTGFISLDGRAAGQFNEHDAQLALIYANQVAIALENAHLFTELQEELKVSDKLIEELENKNAELERFTYTVSHDLKSPLITIRGFLGFIEQDTASGNLERLRLDIQRISDATEKMQRLLQELLQLSRIGRIKNESTHFSFVELAREAIENVHGQILERQIEVSIQDDMPAVYGDRPRILEVLQNLVDNAAKFMGDQPKPFIRIGQQGEAHGKPVFFVQDNGSGMDPAYHERVFGLFNKLDTDTEGTGIGLAIVKRIIEVHGGNIWVESEEGQGATFFFTLPKAADDEQNNR